MAEPAIVRAAHLSPFLAVLREIGEPVERWLERSDLPAWIEQSPDERVSVRLVLDFIAGCGHSLGLMELGYLAASRTSLASMSPQVQRAVVLAPTGRARVEAAMRLAHLEDSALTLRMQREGEAVRILCDMARFERSPFLCLAEWVNLQAIVSIVRSVAGPAWCPAEMTFVSRRAPAPVALEAYANTRVLVGQPRCSLTIEAALLARSSPPGGEALPAGPPPPTEIFEVWTFASALRSVVRPYLGEGYPDLARTAEIVGMSRRTLQRRLQALGCSYSEIVQQARFELARDLLADPGVSIIDVAMVTGYRKPQHFSRAFRRIAGVSPSLYRSHALGQASSA